MAPIAPKAAWPKTKDGSIIVGVTGFGLWQRATEKNSSSQTRDGLPDVIKAATRLGSDIHIFKHPTVPVQYAQVTAAAHDVWASDNAAFVAAAAEHGVEYESAIDADTPLIHFSLHMGSAPARPMCTLEQIAQRDGYTRRDMTDQTPSRSAEEAWQALPAELRPDMDVAQLVSIVNARHEAPCVVTSDDAGGYTCGYMFYASQAELLRRGLERRALFLHVPDLPDDAALQAAVETATEVVIVAADYVQQLEKMAEAARAGHGSGMCECHGAH